MMVVEVGSALADANENGHNCAGALSSDAGPVGPEFGHFVSGIARSEPGVVGEHQQEVTDQEANCGASNR
jgi:hypothetical protein